MQRPHFSSVVSDAAAAAASSQQPAASSQQLSLLRYLHKPVFLKEKGVPHSGRVFFEKCMLRTVEHLATCTFKRFI